MTRTIDDVPRCTACGSGPPHFNGQHCSKCGQNSVTPDSPRIKRPTIPIGFATARTHMFRDGRARD